MASAWTPKAAVAALALGLVALRLAWPERPMEATGSRALIDALFALGLLGLLVGIAAAAGRRCLAWLGLGIEDRLLDGLLFATIGLGLLSSGVAILGMLGWLGAWTISVWCLMVGLIGWPHWQALPEAILAQLRSAPRAWAAMPGWKRLCALAFAGILALSFVQTLTPPWDYDGLMYHLFGAKRFLELGRIVLLPDMLQANSPMNIEMLYTIGLAFGSESFAKLVHFSFACLLVLATFAVGRRMIGGNAGWLAAAVLVGTPIYPMWASLAYVDMGWALYQFLAVVAILEWRRTDRAQWLLLSGALAGWAASSKYLGLPVVLIVAFWIMITARSFGARGLLRRLAAFAAPAAILASPWYLKNWMLSGNPFYPLLFGGPEWGPLRLGLLEDYLGSFGTGESLLDFLLLPVNLFLHRGAFGTYMTRMEIPHPLFMLALLSPLAGRRRLRGLGLLTLGTFAAWSLGSQQTRFLLPTFPALAVLAAGGMIFIGGRWRQIKALSLLGISLVGGLLAVTLIFQIMFFRILQPMPVVLGGESKDTFLRRAAYDYAAIQYVRQELPSDARILMLWDGQGYYCDRRCIPDAEQAQWTRLTLANPGVSQMAAELNRQGIGHLFLSLEGMNFFLHHDPHGHHRRASEFLIGKFVPQCGKEIYRDPAIILYEIECS